MGEESESSSSSSSSSLEKKSLRFPRLATEHARVKIEPLTDESQEEASGNMWQVYALGGFLIVRWLWARWMGRRDGGEDFTGDD